MPKNSLIEDADDDSLEVDLTPQKPSRKFSGTDADPIDDDTGEELFADITPRLRDLKDEEPEEDEEQDDEDEKDVDSDEEEDQDDEDEDDRDLEAVDSDEDERPRKGKPSSWKRRLEREKRLREEEQENNRELRERLTKLEQATQSRADTETFNRESAELKSKIKDAQTRLAKAIEDGDSEAQATISDELLDFKVDLKAKQVTHDRAVAEAKTAKESGSSNTIVVRKVNQWMRKHPRYKRDVVFQGFVKGVDREVASDGFDPESDEFYRELDRRIKKRYPEEYKGERKRDEDTDTGEEEDPKPRRKHPSANLRRGGDGQSKKVGDFQIRGNKVKLTDRQRANMRAFGMDPTNKDDVREYVSNNLPRRK
jgi:hypothetical protein